MSSIIEYILRDETLRRIFLSLFIMGGAFFLVRISRRLLYRYVDDPDRRYRLNKLVGRLSAGFAALIILVIWSPGTQNFFTFLTVAGAGLAIALRDTLLSLAGWVDIVSRTPFSQGDRIEMGGVQGDVVDIRLLHTTLMEIGNWVEADQSTGRLVHVPNQHIFTSPTYNYTRGFSFIWHELPLTLTFRSDWKAARKIMLAEAREQTATVKDKASRELQRLSKEYYVHYSILTPFVYVRPNQHGVQLTLRYLCEVRKRRGTEHALTLSILEAFAEHGDIEFAYPMTGVSVYDSPQFGPMPDASPPPSGKHQVGHSDP